MDISKEYSREVRYKIPFALESTASEDIRRQGRVQQIGSLVKDIASILEVNVPVHIDLHSLTKLEMPQRGFVFVVPSLYYADGLGERFCTLDCFEAALRIPVYESVFRKLRAEYKDADRIVNEFNRIANARWGSELVHDTKVPINSDFEPRVYPSSSRIGGPVRQTA